MCFVCIIKLLACLRQNTVFVTVCVIAEERKRENHMGFLQHLSQVFKTNNKDSMCPIFQFNLQNKKCRSANDYDMGMMLINMLTECYLKKPTVLRFNPFWSSSFSTSMSFVFTALPTSFPTWTHKANKFVHLHNRTGEQINETSPLYPDGGISEEMHKKRPHPSPKTHLLGLPFSFYLQVKYLHL